MEGITWRDRLRAKITERGRSLQDVSLAAGRSRNYLRSILAEGKEPGLLAFVEICEVLQVNPLWVLYGGEEGFTATAELLREFARLTPEQQTSFFALIKTMQPRP